MKDWYRKIKINSTIVRIFIFLFTVLILLFAVFVYPKLPNRTEARDNSGNGKIETWITYKFWKQKTAFVDGNEDGKIDYWQYISASGKTEREELDNNFDGKPDFWAYYDNNYAPIRIERDENFDGQKDTPKENETLDNSAFAPFYEQSDWYQKINNFYYVKGKLVKKEWKPKNVIVNIDYYNDQGVVIKSEMLTDDGKTVNLIDYYNDQGALIKSEALINGKMETVSNE